MLVKHPNYKEKDIPDAAIDKFLDFGWSASPPAVDSAVKSSHKSKEEEKAVQYAAVNGTSIEEAKKAVKGTIR